VINNGKKAFREPQDPKSVNSGMSLRAGSFRPSRKKGVKDWIDTG